MATRGPQSLFAGKRPLPAHVAVYVFVVVPFLALVAAVPFAWGWGLTWVDIVLAACWYTVTCLGGDGRVPPVLHAQFVQGQAVAAHRAGRRRQHGRTGPDPALGRRPPPAPRVLRQGGRSALAVAVRHVAGRAGARVLARAPGLDPQPRPDQPAPLRARPAGGPRHPYRAPAVRLVHGGHVDSARRDGRSADLVVVGRGHGVLLGEPGQGDVPAPRDVVGELGVPPGRRAAVHDPRQVGELLADGDPEHGRVVAQPAPRRPDVRPARREARPDRHLGAPDLAVREGRPRLRRALADRAAVGPDHRDLAGTPRDAR